MRFYPYPWSTLDLSRSQVLQYPQQADRFTDRFHQGLAGPATNALLEGQPNASEWRTFFKPNNRGHHSGRGYYRGGWHPFGSQTACMLTFACERTSKYPSRQTLTHPLFPELTKDRRSLCKRQTPFRLRKSPLRRESTPDLFLTLARIPQTFLHISFAKDFLEEVGNSRKERLFGKVSRLLRPVGPGLLSQNPSPGSLSQGPYGLSPCQECNLLRKPALLHKRVLPWQQANPPQSHPGIRG